MKKKPTIFNTKKRKHESDLLKEKVKNGEIMLYPDHPKPVSRRDFMASGLIPFSAGIVAPSLFKLLRASEAQAAECPAVGPTPQDYCGYLGVSAEGGMASGSQTVSAAMPNPASPEVDYNIVFPSNKGMGSNPARVSEFANNSQWYNGSAGEGPSSMLEGIRLTTSAATRAKTVCISLPTFCNNDNGFNPMSNAGTVTKIREGAYAGTLGTNGRYLSTVTGGPSTPAIQGDYPLRGVTTIGSVQQFQQSLGDNIGPLNGNQTRKVLGALKNLTTSQLGNIAASDPRRVLAELVDCATLTNRDLAEAANTIQLDPRFVPEAQQAYNLSPASSGHGETTVFAAIVHALLQDYTDVGNVTVTGCDYHNGTFSTGRGKNRQVGRTIGMALELASLMGKKLFIHLTTDGSCYANENGWAGDSTYATCTHMIFAIGVDGPPVCNGFQIGAYTADGGLDKTVLTDVKDASLAVLINYLSFNGRLSELDQLVPGVSPTFIQQVLRITG